MISPVAAAAIPVNSIERPLLLQTPNATPVIAHTGAPLSAVSPLVTPVETDATTVPELATDEGSLQVANSQQSHAGNFDGAAERGDVPLPRFHVPGTRDSQVGQMLGTPRVIGLPVEDAMVSLPDNCCEERCRGLPFSEVTEFRRMVIAKCACFTAVNVAIMCFCAEILLANGNMPWEKLKPGAAEKLNRSSIDRCIRSGEPPYEIIIGASLYILSALVTLVSSTSILAISRGCILCCAPAPCCGRVCSAGALLVLSLFQMTVSMPIYFWLIYWPIQDMDACAACKVSTIPESQMEYTECEAFLTMHNRDLISGSEVVFSYDRGVGTVVGMLSACAIGMAGYYCALVPSAISLEVSSYRLVVILGSVQGYDKMYRAKANMQAQQDTTKVMGLESIGRG